MSHFEYGLASKANLFSPSNYFKSKFNEIDKIIEITLLETDLISSFRAFSIIVEQ